MPSLIKRRNLLQPVSGVVLAGAGKRGTAFPSQPIMWGRRLVWHGSGPRRNDGSSWRLGTELRKLASSAFVVASHYSHARSDFARSSRDISFSIAFLPVSLGVCEQRSKRLDPDQKASKAELMQADPKVVEALHQQHPSARVS